MGAYSKAEAYLSVSSSMVGAYLRIFPEGGGLIEFLRYGFRVALFVFVRALLTARSPYFHFLACFRNQKLFLKSIKEVLACIRRKHTLQLCSRYSNRPVRVQRF